MEGIGDVRYTERLRLEPVGRSHVEDLWRLHQDDAVAQWYGGSWTQERAQREAVRFGSAWRTRGFHKWMAYGRTSGELIGRGGLSTAMVDGEEQLEIGWTLRGAFWGQGYATEIGRAGLAFAFDDSLPSRSSR
jgi:RimJ/RimL family protein N-acetyltransferase